MRATFLTQYYPPEVGAPQTRISALATGLGALGVDVTVHTCPPHYPGGAILAPHRNRLLAKEGVGATRIVRSAVYPAANSGFGRRLANHLSFAGSALLTAPASGPADVVVVESPPLFLAGAAIPYAQMKRARLVINVADLWPDSAIELGALRSPAAIRGARAIERAAYRAAAAISCPTEGIVETLGRRPESAEKAVLLRPSVDLDRFDPSPPRGDGSERRPLRVLYAGTVGMAHGLETLLDAAEEVAAGDGPPVEVTIAGDGAEATELRARLRDWGPANTRMLGAVAGEEIPGLYAQCDVAVVMLRDLPVFHGALPTKMLEAMAAGRPVVLSARGEAASLIENEQAGVVVEPESPEALAAALRELAAAPERRLEMGRAGRRAVERSFGREDWLRRWHALLAGELRGARGKLAPDGSALRSTRS